MRTLFFILWLALLTNLSYAGHCINKKCQPFHKFHDCNEFDINIDMGNDFCWSKVNLRCEPFQFGPEIYMRKALRCFKLKKYAKCLKYLKIIEKHLYFNTCYGLDPCLDLSKIITCKGYCYMYLGRYEKAAECFDDLYFYSISSCDGSYSFETSFSYACCLLASGFDKQAEECFSHWIDNDSFSSYTSDSSCYTSDSSSSSSSCTSDSSSSWKWHHPCRFNLRHLASLNHDIAETTGYPIFTDHLELLSEHCQKENVEETIPLANIAAYAISQIPDKRIQKATLMAIARMQVQWLKACQDDKEGEHCLKSFKSILTHAIDQQL